MNQTRTCLDFWAKEAKGAENAICCCDIALMQGATLDPICPNLQPFNFGFPDLAGFETVWNQKNGQQIWANHNPGSGGAAGICHTR